MTVQFSKRVRRAQRNGNKEKQNAGETCSNVQLSERENSRYKHRAEL
jgi:hypothetical protein